MSNASSLHCQYCHFLFYEGAQLLLREQLVYHVFSKLLLEFYEKLDYFQHVFHLLLFYYSCKSIQRCDIILCIKLEYIKQFFSDDAKYVPRNWKMEIIFYVWSWQLRQTMMKIYFIFKLNRSFSVSLRICTAEGKLLS